MSPSTFHMDGECEEALIRLNDALCSFERATDRQYALLLIPEAPDEQIFISHNGKPIPEDMEPEELLCLSMKIRRRNQRQGRRA